MPSASFINFTMANPHKAFTRTLRLEGGWSNRPEDPGGATYMGITDAEFPGLPAKLRAMPVDEAQAEVVRIMLGKYWRPLSLDLVEDDDVAAEVFDTGYNCGPGTAAMIVQKLCRAGGMPIVIDGVMGPRTVTALNVLVRESKARVLVVLNCLQGARYVDLCLNPIEEKASRARTFFRGWIDHRVQLKPVTLSETRR